MSTTPPDLSRLRIDRPEPASPPSRRPVALIVGAIAAVALLAAFLMGWIRPGGRTPMVQVALASAVGGSISGGGITANGYVVARTKASVSAKVPGRLAYLGVSEGSVVQRGQVIARLENDDYKAAVDAARARLQQLEVERDQSVRDLERSRRLHEEHVVSDAELENQSARSRSLAAQSEAARAELGVAQASYDNTIVRSPFAGTVLRKDAEVGEFVAPSTAGGGLTRTAIVTMADLSTLEVEVDVNEAYIAQVANGQGARITLDAYPDTSFAGRVRQVVPTADRQKATVQVKVAILDRDRRILPEMGAKVEFVHSQGIAATASAPRRVLIPAAAVSRDGDRTQAWVIENGRVKACPVDVGPARGDQVEIRSGLVGGESVVLNAPSGLKEGSRGQLRRSAPRMEGATDTSRTGGPMGLVEVKNVLKVYRRDSQEVPVLDGLSLEVGEGDFVALMGPSGSGKTTLLNLIGGIDQPTSGEVTVSGDALSRLNPRELARWRSRHIGYIYQLYNLIPVLTAVQNVELPLLLLKMTRKERLERAQHALNIVGLADRQKHFPRQLSGGQEQRVAIARAVVSDPTLLLADEPTGDLDRKSGQEILGLLERLNREFKKTILMVTHDPHAAERAHRVLNLDKGVLSN